MLYSNANKFNAIYKWGTIDVRHFQRPLTKPKGGEGLFIVDVGRTQCSNLKE